MAGVKWIRIFNSRTIIYIALVCALPAGHSQAQVKTLERHYTPAIFAHHREPLLGLRMKEWYAYKYESDRDVWRLVPIQLDEVDPDGKYNKRFYDLIHSCNSLTSTPILVNTSFNIRGEPIVESPENALNCFLGTDMDYLVLEDIIISKKDIDPTLLVDYKHKFSLD